MNIIEMMKRQKELFEAVPPQAKGAYWKGLVEGLDAQITLAEIIEAGGRESDVEMIFAITRMAISALTARSN